MNKLAAVAACLLLCACESEEQAKAKWIAFCVSGEFSAKQCEVLYSLKKSSDDAQSSADASSAMGAMAVGIVAGSSGGRR